MRRPHPSDFGSSTDDIVKNFQCAHKAKFQILQQVASNREPYIEAKLSYRDRKNKCMGWKRCVYYNMHIIVTLLQTITRITISKWGTADASIRCTKIKAVQMFTKQI